MLIWPVAPFVHPYALTNAALLREIHILESRHQTPSETDDLIRLYDELYERADDPYDHSIGKCQKHIIAR